MKRLLRGAAIAAMAAGAVFASGAAPASADEPGSCVWPEDGSEYPAGTVKEEFWGTENRPDGTVAHRFRLFRCENGAWYYQGDRYYPAGGGGGDDDDWGGGGGGGGRGGGRCSPDPWDWDWDWSEDPLCYFQT